jgi:folylpolyglutamate synthase/dihydropteroate synthase
LPGRAEIVGRHPLVVLDGAHNPDGVAALRATLDQLAFSGHRIVVLGMLEGRDPQAMVRGLGLGPDDLVIACEPDWTRRIPADDVAAAARTLGLQSEVVPAVADALERALAVAGEDDLVVVTGSIYTVGAARATWRAGREDEDRELDSPEER